MLFQRRHQIHRDTLLENVLKELQAYQQEKPLEAVNFRKVFQDQLFGLSLKEVHLHSLSRAFIVSLVELGLRMVEPLQVLGNDVESVYVEELKTTFSREEIFEILVIDPMKGAIEVDWRDFFPYLKWIPNKSFENTVQQMYVRRQAVMTALIKEQRKRISNGKVHTVIELAPFEIHFNN